MAVDFESGSSQYLYADAADITAVPLTFAAWINLESLTSVRQIFDLHASGSAQNRDSFQLYAETTGALSARTCSSSAATATTTTTTMSTATWYHVAGVWSSATSRLPYINGATDGTPGTANRVPSGINQTGIGLIRGSSPGLYFDGLIAECGLWNVALSAQELLELAAGSSPRLVRPDALVSYWPLLDNSGYVDWWSQRNLTQSGTPVYAQHPPGIIYPSATWTHAQTAAAATVGGFISVLPGFLGLIGSVPGAPAFQPAWAVYANSVWSYGGPAS